jgi:hypothetical protein
MPIGSYPRITLNETGNTRNPQSGTGLAIYNQENGQYEIADSNLFPINNGGFASNNNLNRIYNNTANTVDNTDVIATRLLANSDDSTAGDNLADIRTLLNIIQSNLANGTYSIQIKGSNGNLADVSAAHRLNVAL